jgi:glutamate transport system substrate-binding protein
MRKTRTTLLALLLALAMIAAACGGEEPEEAESPTEEGGAKPVPTFQPGTTMAAIQTEGKLTVGTKFDQPLFGQKNPINNEIEGFDVEIAKILAQGIFGGTLEEAAEKVEFVETVSRVREANITEGKVDFIVATYTINDARKQVVDFAGPYYIAGQDIMVKKDDNSIRGVEDLNGKKVCSVQGSTSIVNVQQRAPQADISISFDAYSKCAEALTDGRVQAVTTDDTILVGLIKDDPENLKLVGETFTTEPYGIGLRKGDDAFRDFLNDRIEESYDDGSWAAAFERTVGTAGIETPEPPPVDRYPPSGAAPSPTGTGSPAASPTATAASPAATGASPAASPTATAN